MTIVHDDTGTTLRERLTIIQNSLKVPKSQFNSFAKYHYRNCEDILEALKPLLYEQGVALVLSDAVELVGTRFYVRATATLSLGSDSLSVSALAREPEEKKGTDASQITGAASSYARKYALAGLFLIDDTKDADATNDHGKAEQPRPKPQTQHQGGGMVHAAAKPLPKPAEPQPQPKTDRAHSGLVMQVADLCQQTGTDLNQLYAHYRVVNSVPTDEQAKTMLAALKKKLDKQLDATAAQQTSAPAA